MKIRWLETTTTYDGSQLRPLHNYLEHQLLGDSIVGWIGPCQVMNEHMVDGEDINMGAKICGESMVHFLIEKFDSTLLAAVGLQRLLASIVRDVVGEMASDGAFVQSQLNRQGDDVFFGEQKFSISVATQGAVSSLIHFAVNVTNAGTPVSTCALEDFDIPPERFAKMVMERFVAEVEDIVTATQKVRTY